MAVKLPQGVSKKELTAEFFDQYLFYNESTGWLHWRQRGVDHFPNEHQMKVWNSRQALSPAGTTKSHPIGYGKVQITLAGKTFSAHRIIALMTGMIEFYGSPELVDHIDGNPANNKKDNLRTVSHEINLRNQKRRRTNKGVSGVNFHEASRKWQASIGRGSGKSKLIGYFDDRFEAICARKSEEIRLGYTQRHCRLL